MLVYRAREHIKVSERVVACIMEGSN